MVRRGLLARFDSIDHKIMFLLQEVGARGDALSLKVDQSLWTVSQKLDSSCVSAETEYRSNAKRLDALSNQLASIDRRLVDVRTELLDTVRSEGQRRLEYLESVITQ